MTGGDEISNKSTFAVLTGGDIELFLTWLNSVLGEIHRILQKASKSTNERWRPYIYTPFATVQVSYSGVRLRVHPLTFFFLSSQIIIPKELSSFGILSSYMDPTVACYAKWQYRPRRIHVLKQRMIGLGYDSKSVHASKLKRILCPSLYTQGLYYIGIT